MAFEIKIVNTENSDRDKNEKERENQKQLMEERDLNKKFLRKKAKV
jgi:hypothetical protein